MKLLKSVAIVLQCLILVCVSANRYTRYGIPFGEFFIGWIDVIFGISSYTAIIHLAIYCCRDKDKRKTNLQTKNGTTPKGTFSKE